MKSFKIIYFFVLIVSNTLTLAYSRDNFNKIKCTKGKTYAECYEAFTNEDKEKLESELPLQEAFDLTVEIVRFKDDFNKNLTMNEVIRQISCYDGEFHLSNILVRDWCILNIDMLKIYEEKYANMDYETKESRKMVLMEHFYDGFAILEKALKQNIYQRSYVETEIEAEILFRTLLREFGEKIDKIKIRLAAVINKLELIGDKYFGSTDRLKKFEFIQLDYIRDIFGMSSDLDKQRAEKKRFFEDHLTSIQKMQKGSRNDKIKSIRYCLKIMNFLGLNFNCNGRENFKKYEQLMIESCQYFEN